MDETRDANTHKKRKKDDDIKFESDTVPDNTNSTSMQSNSTSMQSNSTSAQSNSTSAQSTAENKKTKKKKKKNSGTKLPTISDDRLKAYGINPKKFKYFHQKKLLKEQK